MFLFWCAFSVQHKGTFKNILIRKHAGSVIHNLVVFGSCIAFWVYSRYNLSQIKQNKEGTEYE